MIRVYLVRHPETIWNAERRIQGQLDVELSEKGTTQAQALGRALRDRSLQAIYASDLKRAWCTAEIVAGNRSVQISRTPLLREASFGRWEGLTMTEVRERFPDDAARYLQDSVAHRPSGGETLEQVIARCGRFLETVTQQHEGAGVLVVGHSGSVKGILCAALGLPTEFFPRLSIWNASLTTLDHGDRGYILMGLNDICHLSGLGGHGMEDS